MKISLKKTAYIWNTEQVNRRFINRRIIAFLTLAGLCVSIVESQGRVSSFIIIWQADNSFIVAHLSPLTYLSNMKVNQTAGSELTIPRMHLLT